MGYAKGNFVFLFGITRIPATGQYALVLDYIDGGNLRHFHARLLATTSARQYCWLKTAQLVAYNLSWIHASGILHRDFHGGNILMRSDGIPHTSDLGLATYKNQTDATNEIRGVIPYMAPEYLQHGLYTSSSEVYSLGVLLWEISAGRPPFAGQDFNLLRYQIVHQHRRELPIPNTPDWYRELYQWCWHPDPERRPSSVMVDDILYLQRDPRGIVNIPGNDYPAL